MVPLLVALAAAPWAHPLAFRPLAGWSAGASGATRSVYVGHGRWVRGPVESAAWIAQGVRYRDPATADPPNRTLARLRGGAIVVWAVVSGARGEHEKPIRLDVARARRFACCDAVSVAAEYELTGSGPHRAYSVIVRIYFGSRPDNTLRAEAQRALRRLELPLARRTLAQARISKLGPLAPRRPGLVASRQDWAVFAGRLFLRCAGGPLP